MTDRPPHADQAATPPGRRPPTDPAQRPGQSVRRVAAVSAGAVGARQAVQLVFGLALARTIGPDAFAVVAAAGIYVILCALVLDQGLSSALVQAPTLTRSAPGALVTVNLLASCLLAGLTWVTAPAVADFFQVPDLRTVLRLLGFALLLKAAAIAPRAMLSRTLRFSPLARADVLAAVGGGAAGFTALAAGAGYFSFVVQVVVTDALVTVLLAVSARGPVPNLRLRDVRPLVPFGARILATNTLAFVSSNADGILVGRFLGAHALGLYSVAFRVLVVPVVLLGQTVHRVLFPVFSRSAGDPARTARALLLGTQLLALSAVPLMAWTACVAPTAVHLALGPRWSDAALLVSVLAVAGARESIFFITPALMRGLGQAGMNLRFQVLSTTMQVAGVAAGLPFGVTGVAVGYTVAGFALTPVLMGAQRRLAGVTTRQQLAAILPAVHASCWAAAAFLAVSVGLGGSARAAATGTVVFAVILATVLGTVHRRWLQAAVSVLRRGSLAVL